MYHIFISLLHKQRDNSLPSRESPEILANDFVTFFSDKIKAITESFPQEEQCSTNPSTPDFDPLDAFQPVTHDDLEKLINSGNSKCCHLDPIPTDLLKECLDSLLSPLVRIINTFLEACIVPSSFKAATVTPLLKKAGLDQEEMKNYRPVSNLPYVSKLLEKVVVAQLNEHLKDNSLMPPNQSAYRRHHSTETALVRIVNDLLCAMDRSQCCLLIMLDQSAAFDTVNQDILLTSMQHAYGITGSALAWLNSYFKKRTQSVCIASVSSSPREQITGFPQGSVLGSFSYPVYTAPLFSIAEKHKVSMHMYADDTQLFVAFDPNDTKQAVGIMHSCVKAICTQKFPST